MVNYMDRPGDIIGEDKDIEELERVLETVSKFLGEIGPSIASSISAVIEAYPGEKIGKQVADFYKKLREEGVPEELAEELTKKYFDSLNIFNKISELIRKFPRAP